MSNIKHQIILGNCETDLNQSIYEPEVEPPITWDMTTITFDSTIVTFDSL